jgi:radical SAM superfamily enzyme YgiQ (UPF0313 family)
LGLASLSAVLLRSGHTVAVLDEVLYEEGVVPDLKEVIAREKPDVIGFSAYTSTLDRLLEHLRAAREVCQAPILVGGPHASLWPEHLGIGGLVDYVVRGEAEEVIAGLVTEAVRREQPAVIEATVPDVRTLPWPDYSAVMKGQSVRTYPIMTSRGCPYACSFCAVRHLTTRKWRARDPVDCAAEVAAARQAFPGLECLKVSDDCPTAIPEHFKTFLRDLSHQQPRLHLVVDNTRADKVDEELVMLLRDAGATEVCLGVEHGHPEVFALVNKGETLEDIRRAAEAIKKQGLDLGLCFVIGLPGDTFERTGYSIRLARELGPSSIFWNMAHPFPGTEMHRWFIEHGGTIDAPRNYTSFDHHTLNCAEPVVSTPEFTKWERKRAPFWAVLETGCHPLTGAMLRRMITGAVEYRLPWPVLRALIRRPVRGVWRRLRRAAARAARKRAPGAGETAEVSSP